MVAKKARVRRSAEETREVLLAEGLRQLQDQGVHVGLDHLTLESACAATGVPRSSSHAAWAIDDDFTPQALFQRSVLKTWLLDREALIFAAASQAAVADAFERRGDELTRGDIIRVAIQASFSAGHNLQAEKADGGDYLSTDMAIRHAIASQPDGDRDEEILGWLQHGELKNREDRIADTYRPMGELLGMKPRAEYGERAYVLFGIAIAALVEGIGMRHAILPELELDKPIFPAVGDDEPTMLIGACCEALVDSFFEPIDPTS
jgi:hypothetical protein